MELKKSEKADLQSKKFLFTQIGLVLSLLLLFGVFNLSQAKVELQVIESTVEEVVADIPEITRPEEPQKPRVQKVVAPAISDVIEVMDNTVELEDDSKIFDTEATDDTQIFTGLPTGVPNDGDLLDEEVVVYKAEVNPDFQGAKEKSQEKFRVWVQKAVKFPSIALENGISGVVNVKFVIGVDGKLKNIEILSSPDRSLSEEVMRALNSSPAWKPGLQREKPVAVHGTVRVVFQSGQ